MYHSLSLLPLLLIFTLLSDTTASLTLLITGPIGANVYKHKLARLFVESYDEIIKGSPPQLSVFTNGVVVPFSTDERHMLQVWDDTLLPVNVTTVIVTNASTDEIGLNYSDILQRMMKTTGPLIVVEFGDPTNETRTLLENTVKCQTTGHVSIASPNIVYFCNSASPMMLSSVEFDNFHEFESLEQNAVTAPWQRTIWPKVFVSAIGYIHRRKHSHEHHFHHYHHHHRTHHHHRGKPQFEENIDEIVNEIMEEIAEQDQIPELVEYPVKQPTEYQKKLACKYRKSCYETGMTPIIESGLFNFLTKWWPKRKETEVVAEKEGEKNIAILYDPEVDLIFQKFRCHYRYSCYQERGIPCEKLEEKRKVLISSKRLPHPQPPERKKTLKEIAADVLKQVEVALEKANKRPAIKLVERRINEVEEKRNEKLNCKYRKSCYETGEKPVIEEAWSLPLPIKIFSTETADTVTKEINYEELEELEKKVYCKYRKSCYETGVKPDIEPEIFIRTFADLTTLHEQVEPRKMTLQERCKYRKSCYETGIVPEINPKLEAVIHKEVSNVIPTSTQDLRLLCKYRKSCYAKVHDSATVDTIKLIRKRRQIEKEVSRRRAKRAKLHRSLRGEMQLGSYHRFKRSNKTDKHIEDETEEQEPEEIMELRIVPQRRDRKEKSRERPKEEVVTAPTKASRSGKLKKLQKFVAEEEERADEPVRMLTIEEIDEMLAVKKTRKGKKLKAEESKVQKIPEKEEMKEKEEVKTEDELTIPEVEKEEEIKVVKTPTLSSSKKKKEKEPKCKDEDKRDHFEHASDGKQGGSKRFDKVADGMKKMIEDMHHQQEVQQHKEFCKYRKSCYKSGKRPKIEQSIRHLLEKFSKHVDRELEKQEKAVAERPKTETEKKLECKYRKSCYETGVLPENVTPQYFYKDQQIVFKAGLSKQLQCKYRKSCYVETGLISPEDVGETEQKRSSSTKNVSQEDKILSLLRKHYGDDAESKLLRPLQTSTDAATRAIGKEGEEAECKSGGKSCYSSAEPRAMKEDHAGGMARIGLERYLQTGWCNQYYYSCREILGLPPKERAPVGPNGKRLCRKKPL